LRSLAKKRLLKSISEKSGPAAEVTEQTVLNAVKETTPERFLEKSLQGLEPLKTMKRSP